MAKTRYLAPWHQPDLMAALEALTREYSDGEGPGKALDAEALAALKGKPAIYHCISRVVDRQFVLGTPEKEKFVDYMRAYERFCQVRVLGFSVMTNHFHILLEIPSPPKERGRDWSDERFLDHLACLYTMPEVGEIRWELERFRKQGNDAAAEALRDRYFRRMWDLSEYMKSLKQRFSRWFNWMHGRRGTLWEERFKSVLVEDGHAARVMAAYIDLNAMRAGIVKDPKDYRWCSYGEAVAGKERAREGIRRVMFESESTVTGKEQAAEMLLSWQAAGSRYREVLMAGMQRDAEKSAGRTEGAAGVEGAAGAEGEEEAGLSEAEALRCRVRYFVDGLVIGSKGFVNRVFQMTRERFGPKRRDGARKIRGIRTELQSMRDLRPE